MYWIPFAPLAGFTIVILATLVIYGSSSTGTRSAGAPEPSAQVDEASAAAGGERSGPHG